MKHIPVHESRGVAERGTADAGIRTFLTAMSHPLFSSPCPTDSDYRFSILFSSNADFKLTVKI